MSRFLGIDGCKAGWIAVTWTPATGHLSASIAAKWQDITLEEVPAAAVDMPIGLTERGPRACDLAARALLPADRKSSVFPAPRRYMLGCGSWREAQDQGRSREGKGLPKQAWNITSKIAEIDTAITAAIQDRVFEAHPELIFFELNERQAVPRKRSQPGLALRLSLLERAGLRSMSELFDCFSAKDAKKDDIIDAAACAYAAQRIHAGRATRLPPNPPLDSRGLRMEIWF